MSVEKRPYVGTWKLNNQQLVQHTPDALVYINGDTSVPGCPKCSGKIDLQKFLTEVSVDAGTEPGSSSATFSLSIPLHHTDSFARDAKFILRPGLEVHIYMRGYFPVKGLYSNLAESSSKNDIGASSYAPSPSAQKEAAQEAVAAQEAGGGKVTLDGFINYKRKKPATAITIHESGTSSRSGTIRALQSNGTGIHYIVGNDGVWQYYKSDRIVNHTGGGDTNAYSIGIEFNHAYHGSGQSIPAPWFHKGKYTVPSQSKLELLWNTTATVAQQNDIPIQFGGVQGNQFNFGAKSGTTHAGISSHKQQAGGHSDGVFPVLYMSLRQRGYTSAQAYQKSIELASGAAGSGSVTLPPPVGSGTYHNPGINQAPTPRGTYKEDKLGKIAKKALAEGRLNLADLQPPDVHEGGATTPETPPVEVIPKPERAETGQFGPSLLESMGLGGMGIENTLAYPYYHVFHGVMTEVSHSYSGGVNTISVNCSSMLHFWQYHNMSTNASVFGARATNSKNKMSMVGNNFTGMHPYAIMYSLHYDMAGAAGGVGWALSAKSNQTAVSQGGESLFSLNVRYWEKRFRRGTKLRMHGATGELFSTMSSAWLSRKSSGALSGALRDRFNSPKSFAGTKIGSEMVALGLYGGPNVRSAIDATRFAAQSKGDPKNSAKFEINILEMQAFTSNIGDWGQINLFESTYESKLDIANKVCDITGFEFFQDVDGDFVFKPPMWNLDTSTSRIYRLEDIDLINISFSEKEPQATYMTVKGSHFKNILGTGLENEWGVRGQYIDYRLVAQFGWRPGSYETNYFNDPKSMFFAAVNRMDMMNIGINTASVTIPVRPELRPGYPVYIPYLDCFYYCNSFSHSHSVGGQCTTSLQLVGKRAKFYAPGETTSGRSGITAIRLGDTKLPERPLGVLDSSGKPRMSGFPNVVMALDPTAINPLFFVVGTDIENIADARVVKYLLKTAEQQGIIHEAEDSPEGGSTKIYTMTRTTKKEDGTDGESTEVRFYFDEKDLNPPEKTGKDLSLMYAAVTYKNLLAAQGKKAESTSEAQIEAQRVINSVYSEMGEINRQISSGDPKLDLDKLFADRDKLNKKALKLIEAKEAADLAIVDAATKVEQEWRNPQGEFAGVALLLEVLERTSEAYRSSANFQNRGDLSSTINLLDMLSDKKATFSNGQQPGQYRYFSSSHPDVSEQGPPNASYNEKKQVIEDGKPLSILPDRQPPTVQMYHHYPTAPFAGAAIPEAELRPGQPEAGIRVLTGNPKKPGGEVLAASEITELMFTVQDVSIVKAVTSTVNRSHVSGMGSATSKKILELLMVAVQGSHPSNTVLDTIFNNAWNALAAKVVAGVESAAAAGAALAPPVNLSDVIVKSLSFSVSSVKVGKKTVALGDPVGAYKYNGSSGATSLGSAVDKGSQADFLKKIAAALARIANTKVNSILYQMDIKVNAENPAGREAVKSAFEQGFAIGVPSKATTKARVTKNVAKRETTVSPVFPISDAQGYHVIGSYRYGRGVDIDPEGVFDQLHKSDIFSLLDKNLVDLILQVFVQGKSIKVPKMEEISLGDGKKKIVPVADEEKSGADAAKYLNEEALRQLRAANLSDKQILEYSHALSKGTSPGQLDFSLANYFSDSKLDGVQKVPVINAAYSLADLNFQQAGHVCACKAAEANTLITAFGQAQFVSLAQAGDPAKEGFGSDPADAATRWVATQAELAAVQWEIQQQALRGQVLDRGGSHVVSQFLDTFGIDTPGVQRDNFFEQAVDQGEANWQKVLREKANADTKIDNLGRDREDDQ